MKTIPPRYLEFARCFCDTEREAIDQISQFIVGKTVIKYLPLPVGIHSRYVYNNIRITIGDWPTKHYRADVAYLKEKR